MGVWRAVNLGPPQLLQLSPAFCITFFFMLLHDVPEHANELIKVIRVILPELRVGLDEVGWDVVDKF